MEMPKETASFHKYRQTVKGKGKQRTEQLAVKRQRTEKYHEKMKKALVADERAKKRGMGTYGSGVGFHDESDINEFQGGAGTRVRGGEQQPCIDCGEYDHRSSKSKKCAKSDDFNPAAPAAKRCSACNRRGHASSKSKLCPKHTANLPSNGVSTTSGPVGGGTDGELEEPSATDHSTEQIAENNLVGSVEFSLGIVTDFGTVAASDRASLGGVINTASTIVSERLDTEFSVSQSAHYANVGTGTEVRLEFENDTEQNILNSEDDMRLYANFVDQLDCDVDSTDTNLLDLEDLDIFLEESDL
jgi:hypothetical protein